MNFAAAIIMLGLALQPNNGPRSARHANYDLVFRRDPALGFVDVAITLRLSFFHTSGKSVEHLYFGMNPTGSTKDVRQLRISDVMVDNHSATMKPVNPVTLHRLDLPNTLFPGHIATINYQVSYQIDPFDSQSHLSNFFPLLTDPVSDDPLRAKHPFASFRVRFEQPPSRTMHTTMTWLDTLGCWREDDVTDIGFVFGPLKNEARIWMNSVERLQQSARVSGLPLLRSSMLTVGGELAPRGGIVFVSKEDELTDYFCQAILDSYGIDGDGRTRDALRQVFFGESATSYQSHLARFVANSEEVPDSPLQALLETLSPDDFSHWSQLACLGRLQWLSTNQWVTQLGFVANAIRDADIGVEYQQMANGQLRYRFVWENAKSGAYVLVRNASQEWTCLRLLESMGEIWHDEQQPIVELKVAWDTDDSRKLPVPESLMKRHAARQTEYEFLRKWILSGSLL